MRTTRLLKSLAMMILAPGAIASETKGIAETATSHCVVQGLIEILHPKVKLKGGVPDASGVAVWLTPLKGSPRMDTASQPRQRLVQRDKRFIPHVMVIQVGTQVDFPNNDPFFHNVFSVHEGKRFDLGLYANGESRPVVFDRPGISYIYCNIHPQMSAVIIIVETPYFAVSAAQGKYSITNVPVGSYELRLWHERSDERQLAALNRIVSVGSPVVDLGLIRLDESGYIPTGHKDKHGGEYGDERNQPPYRRP